MKMVDYIHGRPCGMQKLKMPLTYQTSPSHVPTEKFIRGAARFLFREKDDRRNSIWEDYGYPPRSFELVKGIKDILDDNFDCINKWQSMGAAKAGYLLKHDGYSYSIETTLFEGIHLPREAGYELAICTQTAESKIDTLWSTVESSNIINLRNNMTYQSSYQCKFDLGFIINFKGESC